MKALNIAIGLTGIIAIICVVIGYANVVIERHISKEIKLNKLKDNNNNACHVECLEYLECLNGINNDNVIKCNRILGRSKLKCCMDINDKTKTVVFSSNQTHTQ